MLVYTNRGKEIKLKSNEIESIDVVVKKVVGTPFIPYQYVYGFSKVRNNFENEKNMLIEIILRNRIK